MSDKAFLHAIKVNDYNSIPSFLANVNIDVFWTYKGGSLVLFAVSNKATETALLLLQHMQNERVDATHKFFYSIIFQDQQVNVTHIRDICQ